jgi:hypothetical protein
MLIIYDPAPDRPGPDGFLIYTIYGALMDVYVVETPAVSGHNDSDDDMDTDSPQGQAGSSSPAGHSSGGSANSSRNKGRGSAGGSAARGDRGGGAAASGFGRKSSLRDWMPSGPVLRILLLTCAGMLPCDASLARRVGSNNSGLRQIPSARAVQMMSLGMAHVPRQEAAVMLQRVYDCFSSYGDGPVLLAHSRSIPRTTHQTGESDHGQPYPSCSR